ncbi:MAG: hypothetical protein M9952_09495 [Microthrixaceae bacterium]|nr:hypothetical protein [Microthrixaceae bacterium]
MRTLVLSPHFDDAPLSLGQSMLDGRLAGERVTVGVVFSHSNWTRWFHPTRRRWPLATAIRLSEESLASIRLRYRLRLGGFEETVLRSGDLSPSTYLVRDPQIGDDPIVDAVERVVRDWAQGAQRIIAPLGVGDHRDHQIVTEAARRLLVDGLPVEFYEDRPYVTWAVHGEAERIAALVDERLERIAVSGPISETKHRRLFYPSQFTEEFRGAFAADESGADGEFVWALPNA